MPIRFDGRVAIVTGAGAGLGRSHALGLAALGARVVVNDYGGAVDGSGASSEPAERVAEEIRTEGGQAMAHGADVTNADQVGDMVHRAVDAWGRADILINNAGILRDVSFAKMTLADFQKVMDVHLMGSVICSHAVWPHMRAASYGRILMTTSPSGLFGNFGQANYGAAKTALIGLMNVLQIEGEKHGVRVNCLSPGAATRMTEGLIPPAVLELMTPESVTPTALFLVSEEAPRRAILNATAGGVSRTFLHDTEGVYVPPNENTPDRIAELFDVISDTSSQCDYEAGGGPTMKFIRKAAAALGAKLG